MVRGKVAILLPSISVISCIFLCTIYLEEKFSSQSGQRKIRKITLQILFICNKSVQYCSNVVLAQCPSLTFLQENSIADLDKMGSTRWTLGDDLSINASQINTNNTQNTLIFHNIDLRKFSITIKHYIRGHGHIWFFFRVM